MSFQMDTTRTMTGRVMRMVMLAVIFLPIAFVVFGEAVLHLWNWLMPTLFRLPAISFWQAVGLLALSWLLFGGLRGSGPRSGYRGTWRRRMEERWEHMTPEERDKFREWIQDQCGRASAEAQPKP